MGTVDAERVFSREAEEALVGALLMWPDRLRDVAHIVQPGDFWVPEVREVYESLLALAARGEPIGAVGVKVELKRRGLLKEPPGPVVFTLVEAAEVPSTVTHHARIVAGHARDRRRLKLAAEEKRVLIGHGDRDRLAEIDRERRALASAEVAQSSPQERAVDGATFLLGARTDHTVIWGKGEDILHAGGESLLIVGPAGVGKTTLGQQYVLARVGARSDVLGYPVEADERRVLLISADRPMQAARSLARMVSEEDTELLAERLVVWRGPLPFDLALQPAALAEFAAEYDAGTVVIDSLKDVALDLSTDETGSRVNLALQSLLASGVEVVALHHQRKQQGHSKPTKLPDVYGSTWLTAGAGSVLLLWGQPGDPVVEVSHLKQPLGEVGPFRIVHDHHEGRTAIMESLDLLGIVAASRAGVTATEAARHLFETENPSRNEIEKARRKLNDLRNRGQLHRREGSKGGQGGGEPTRWFPVERRDVSEDRSPSDHAATLGGSDHGGGEPITDWREPAGQSDHATVHAVHGSERSRSHPPLGGERGLDARDEERCIRLLQGQLDAEVVSEYVHDREEVS